jgi:methylthioribose-1-phosphate isomerase
MKDLNSLAIRVRAGRVEALDQTLLPVREVWEDGTEPVAMIALIQRLAVRGAPLIGVAAALSLAAFAEANGKEGEIRTAAAALRAARPTAVNLMNAMDRMLAVLANEGVAALSPAAEKIFFEDVELCRRMGERGAAFIRDGEGILTHCNTGGLATAGIGTALGVIRTAFEQGKKLHVFVDETRPLLQGARLTAWELTKLGIPFTLICDNMAGPVLRSGKVQRIFVGADRIAANGDVANKIGTYGLAVLARHHQVPFYVVAPSTTLDPLCPSGAAIPIEERGAEEVRAGKAPAGAPVWNPAFDFTPRALIEKIVLEDREF